VKLWNGKLTHPNPPFEREGVKAPTTDAQGDGALIFVGANLFAVGIKFKNVRINSHPLKPELRFFALYRIMRAQIFLALNDAFLTF
jgi:hypothetical protein